jgi:hypothetical protein
LAFEGIHQTSARAPEACQHHEKSKKKHHRASLVSRGFEWMAVLWRMHAPQVRRGGRAKSAEWRRAAILLLIQMANLRSNVHRGYFGHLEANL